MLMAETKRRRRQDLWRSRRPLQRGGWSLPGSSPILHHVPPASGGSWALHDLRNVSDLSAWRQLNTMLLICLCIMCWHQQEFFYYLLQKDTANLPLPAFNKLLKALHIKTHESYLPTSPGSWVTFSKLGTKNGSSGEGSGGGGGEASRKKRKKPNWRLSQTQIRTKASWSVSRPRDTTTWPSRAERYPTISFGLMNRSSLLPASL